MTAGTVGFGSVYDTTPDAIGVDGNKYWQDKTTQMYARSLELEDLRCFLVELPDGDRVRLVARGTEPLFEANSLEEVGAFLDKTRAIRMAIGSERFVEHMEG